MMGRFLVFFVNERLKCKLGGKVLNNTKEVMPFFFSLCKWRHYIDLWNGMLDTCLYSACKSLPAMQLPEEGLVWKKHSSMEEWGTVAFWMSAEWEVTWCWELFALIVDYKPDQGGGVEGTTSNHHHPPSKTVGHESKNVTCWSGG